MIASAMTKTLKNVSTPILTGLQKIIKNKADSSNYSDEINKGVMIASAMVKTLNSVSKPLFAGLKNIVQSKIDYSSLSIENRKGIMMTASMAITLKNVLEAPLLDEKGALTIASRHVLMEARDQFLAIKNA